MKKLIVLLIYLLPLFIKAQTIKDIYVIIPQQTMPDVSGLAPLANPVFTGTAKIGSDTLATKAYVRANAGTGGGVTDYNDLTNKPTIPTVVSDLTNDAGYITSVPAQSFSSITLKPTTIAGYGITDFNSLGDARWSALSHTHTFSSLTSKPTTLSGYGITDAYPLSGNPSGFLTSVPAQTFASLTSKPTTLSGYGITDGALDNAVMHLSGNETTTNTKSFNQIKFTSGTNQVLLSTGYALLSASTSEGYVGTTAGINNMNVAGKNGVSLNVNGTRILNAVPTGVVIQQTSSYLSPDASSILDVVSTTQGARPVPSMTTTQFAAISTKPEGLQAFDLTKHKPTWYDGTNVKFPLLEGDPLDMTKATGRLDTSHMAQTVIKLKYPLQGGTTGDSIKISQSYLDSLMALINGVTTPSLSDVVTEGNSTTSDISINGINIGLSGGSVSTNTVFGNSAMEANTTGASNVAIGKNALALNSTGSNNLAVGNNALNDNTSGGNNVSFGTYSMQHSGGSDNTAIGYLALRNNPSGGANVAIGRESLISATGNNNTSIGVDALYDLVGGNNNTVIGASAAGGFKSGSGNTVIGANVTLDSALDNNIIIANGSAIKARNDGSNWTFTDPVTVSQLKLSALNTAPSSSTASGTFGEIRITSTYIYVCTATNTWVRSALSTW